MYYTEHKPKNKKQGRPGNEASFTISETGIGYNAWAGGCYLPPKQCMGGYYVGYTTYLRLVVTHPHNMQDHIKLPRQHTVTFLWMLIGDNDLMFVGLADSCVFVCVLVLDWTMD